MVKWKLQVVLTKCDLVERFELARRIQVIKQKVSPILSHTAAVITVMAMIHQVVMMMHYEYEVRQSAR